MIGYWTVFLVMLAAYFAVLGLAIGAVATVISKLLGV